MTATTASIKARIDTILAGFGAPSSLTPSKLVTGKMYEAWALANVLQHLRRKEGMLVKFVNSHSGKGGLRASGGPIDRSFFHFRATSHGHEFEIWTDIEFTTYSADARGSLPPTGEPASEDRHELDIVMVHSANMRKPRYPRFDEIIWGVECKHTKFEKHMARAVLGVRRELSLLSPALHTGLPHWSTGTVPAHPPSILTVYSTSSNVESYKGAGKTFGIDFIKLNLP